MSYLDIARRAESRTKETKEVRIGRHSGGSEFSPGYERNEFDEKSPLRSREGAELLKARIIAAVTVEPEHFDRDEYNQLWSQLHDLENDT